MKELVFTVSIEAPASRIWSVMFDPLGYREWTAPFIEGSYFEGSWEEGAAIRFLSPGGNGMVSRIAVSRPCEFVSIEHLGIIENGVEDTTSEAVRAWAPAYENYTFSAAGDSRTEVTVNMHVTPDFEDYMANTWPTALEALRKLAERNPPPSPA